MNDSNLNIVFITIDSCRYDTFKKAVIPNIKSIGKIKKAHTHATYTVPAHAAFFGGHFPIVLGKGGLPYYSESHKRIIRMVTGEARPSKGSELIRVGGPNIIQGLKRVGYKIFGFGGVTQFVKGGQLRSYFGKDFTYYGPDLDEEPLAPRNTDHFPLNHIDEIVKGVASSKKPWFLFINSPETHYPYDIGNGIGSKFLRWIPILKKSLNLREGQDVDKVPDSCFKEMHKMQIKALEDIDAKIGVLLNKLPKARKTLWIICGDHGESFGEVYKGRKRWGHIFDSKEVMTVPLVIGET